MGLTVNCGKCDGAVFSISEEDGVYSTKCEGCGHIVKCCSDIEFSDVCHVVRSK